MLFNKLTYLILLLYKPGVYFTNLKRADFTYKRLFSSYVLALNKLLYKKHAQKTLMKLSPGVYFTNILRAAFRYSRISLGFLWTPNRISFITQWRAKQKIRTQLSSWLLMLKRWYKILVNFFNQFKAYFHTSLLIVILLLDLIYPVQWKGRLIREYICYVFCAAFLYLQFGFVIFFVKEYGCKSCSKNVGEIYYTEVFLVHYPYL